jgi:hypothetical protein
MNPANMAIPPRGVILFICSFLLSGLSYSFFNAATMIMTGMEKKVIANEITTLKIRSIIGKNFLTHHKLI